MLTQCLTSTRQLTPKINVLDLSSIDTLNKQGVDSFLHIKNLTLPTTFDDSTMIFKDGNPENFHMKQSMIIKIRTITFQNNKTVIVTAGKIKSTSEIINAIIELERHLDGYKIKSLKINN